MHLSIAAAIASSVLRLPRGRVFHGRRTGRRRRRRAARCSQPAAKGGCLARCSRRLRRRALRPAGPCFLGRRGGRLWGSGLERCGLCGRMCRCRNLWRRTRILQRQEGATVVSSQQRAVHCWHCCMAAAGACNCAHLPAPRCPQAAADACRGASPPPPPAHRCCQAAAVAALGQQHIVAAAGARPLCQEAHDHCFEVRAAQQVHLLLTLAVDAACRAAVAARRGGRPAQLYGRCRPGAGGGGGGGSAGPRRLCGRAGRELRHEVLRQAEARRAQLDAERVAYPAVGSISSSVAGSAGGQAWRVVEGRWQSCMHSDAYTAERLLLQQCSHAAAHAAADACSWSV